jgi:ribosomal protein S18 acetylase RimI-like enzyme
MVLVSYTTPPMPVITRRAALDDLDTLALLFDAYRQFYAQPTDLSRARDFLHARLSKNESIVFLAECDGTPAGFTQLYPLFSSVHAVRTFLLNDLFVAEHARRRGVAQALLSVAAEYGRREGAIRLELETMPDNHAAQALYRAQGWQQNDETLRFQLSLAPVWSDE